MVKLVTVLIALILLTELSVPILSEMDPEIYGEWNSGEINEEKVNDGQPQRVIICEGYKRRLSCPRGSVIEISSAIFGRYYDDYLNCWDPSKPHYNRLSCWNNNGTITAATEKYFEDMCNGKPGCTVESNSNIAGDPCPGVFKYTQTIFYCNSVRRGIA